MKKGDCYGYDIANKLAKSIEVAEGSVYPVLRRLKNEGSVTSYLVSSQTAHPENTIPLQGTAKSLTHSKKRNGAT